MLCLLPSPLLGPSVWRPAADVLGAAGWSTLIVPASDPPSWTADDVLDSFLSGIPADRDVVLVAHSNAGLYVAPLAVQRRVTAALFVDARLPPAEGPAAVAPGAFLDVLRGLADDNGLLPPWTTWWPEDDAAALFPNAETRASIERDQPRVPFEYFRESVNAPPDWDAIPCGYLAFGDTYAEETKEAGRCGWPVRTIEGKHLHMVVDPVGVAAQITDVLGSLSVRAQA